MLYIGVGLLINHEDKKIPAYQNLDQDTSITKTEENELVNK